MTGTLPHTLERTVLIYAQPETVFRFLVDSERWASWWGAGSSIDPRPGGRVQIRYPDGTEAAGEVLSITSPRTLVFSYGYVTGAPIAPGGSRVTITLVPDVRGTRLHLLHEFHDPAVRNAHEQGWRYQLAVFSNVVADEVQARAAEVVDAWFAVWALAEETDRERALEGVASPDVSFRDRYGVAESVGELVVHISAVRRFMPGLQFERKGAARHCQGLVLADWIAADASGQQRAGGTNVFAMNAAGRIESVVGFWTA